MANTASFGKIARWYPSTNQMRNATELERALRQMLTQHYALEDRVGAIERAGAASAASANTTPAGAPASGPATTKLLGLNVEPVDVQTLTDGATLKFSKARGTFYFG